MENVSIDYIRLGMFLKQYRESAGYTQKEISSVLDVTPQSVSMWEKGKNKIDIDTLYQLCNLYKTDFSELLKSVSDTKNAPVPVATSSGAKEEEIYQMLKKLVSDLHIDLNALTDRQKLALEIISNIIADNF